MAIYHLTARTGSRGGGQSARAKSDYVNREGKYAKRGDELVAKSSGNMPAWAADPRSYWDAADKHERANGRLFKEIEFALPRELTPDQAVDLAQRFAEHITQAERLPFSLAVHHGADPRDLHCHLVVSERVNDGVARSADTWFKRANTKTPAAGGAKKTTALMPKDWLEQTRADWEKFANRALERAGQSARVDHRSNRARGLETPPQPKLGPAVVAMEEKGIRTDRGEEALQQASKAGREAFQREIEAAYEHRANQGSAEQGRVGRRVDPDSRGHGDAGREHPRNPPADRREGGWFARLVSRYRAPERSSGKPRSNIEEARLETLGRAVSGGRYRILGGSGWLESRGRLLREAYGRWRDQESSAAVERRRAEVAAAERKRQADLEAASRLAVERKRAQLAEWRREREAEAKTLDRAALQAAYKGADAIVNDRDATTIERERAKIMREVISREWQGRQGLTMPPRGRSKDRDGPTR
jgi:hypothetical protein